MERRVYYRNKTLPGMRDFDMFLGTLILTYGEGAERLANMEPVYVIPVDDYEKLLTPPAPAPQAGGDE